MPKTRKTRVAVLYGGRSSEHEVSLQSAKNVIEQLDRSRYEVIPVGIDKSGQWIVGHDVFIKSIKNDQVPLVQDEHATWFAPQWVNQAGSKTLATTPDTDQPFDVIFPVMHGTYCEDGAIQGLLELADVAYVGCGILSSAVNMDKDIAKRLAKAGGIAVAPYLAIKKSAFYTNQDYYLNTITDALHYPFFVKPANTGSSVGISKVKEISQLLAAIEFAFQFDNKILVEQGLTVRELELAVLEPLIEGSEPIVSVVGEIKPHHEFYSYDAKYVDANGASLHIPADVSEDIAQEARRMAKQLFLLLECEGMARIDLFYDINEQKLYFNEVNTIPGFTAISMYPKLMEASGLSYPALLTHLVELAVKRQNIKSQLTRNYVKAVS